MLANSNARAPSSSTVDPASRPPRWNSWATVALFAALMAYADGFLLISLEGAVGVVGRTQHPFASWLLDSTLLLPAFVVAVAGAFALARRRFGPSLLGARRVLATAALVAAAGTAVGVGAIVAGSVYDYRGQAAQAQATAAVHDRTGGAAHDHAACTGRCRSLQETRAVHIRADGLAAGLVLAANLTLVGWGVALCGGRLQPTGGSPPATVMAPRQMKAHNLSDGGLSG